MQTKTAPVQLNIKTARSVLRAKLLTFVGAQREDRRQERELLDAATASGSPSRAEDLRLQANQVHQERICRRAIVRHLAVAYAFALGRRYASQEAKALHPVHECVLVDALLDTQSEVNSTMKRAVRGDIEAWLKGEPTAAQREALAKAEAAIVAGTAFEAAQ